MTTDPATPLEQASAALAGERVWLKREDTHELGAFKWRGALPVVRGYRDGGATTVVTASTGNHGAATAWAARQLGLRAVVFLPELAAEVKVERIASLGADIQRVGVDGDEAKEQAVAFAAAQGWPFFEDGAEPAQYDGYSAIGREILEQLGRGPATVVVPVGGGALIGGVALGLGQGSTVIGVVAKDAPAMADSFDAGRVVTSSRSATIADGLAVRVPIPYAVERIQPVVERMVRVSERELAQAIGSFARIGMRVEASAAAALAALDHLESPAGPVALIVTGRNIDDELFARTCNAPGSFPN